MMPDFSNWLTLVLSTLVIFISSCYVYYRLFSSKYWSKLNVPHLEPVFLLGNLWKAGIFENFLEKLKNLHLKHKEKKILGIWTFTEPSLLVMDLELTKRILVKDFNSFRDRGMEVDTERDPLAGHLFLMQGKAWRNMRVKLTPTFSSGKMKMMYPIVVKCGKQMENYLVRAAEKKEVVEVKDLMARFTTDVIASCAFGIETNSIDNPNSEFREWGRSIFKLDLRTAISNVILSLYPWLSKLIKLRIVPKDQTDYFVNLVKETLEYRERNNVARNDFFQLIIQLMKAGKLEDVDKESNALQDADEADKKFSLLEAAAQCFVFFVAGFETSSTTLAFALYELAINPDVQTRLQEEIDSAMEDNGNGLNYDVLSKMEYLDMVVQETLRKYPPVGILQRKCENDYFIPELDVTIKKGTLLTISNLGIQNDPDIFPDPERFDPERFTVEEKNKRHPMAFLPFGEGPRNCIGNRFGLMQVKIGLTSVFSKFTVEVTETTPIPMELDVKGFIPTPLKGIPLVFKKRI